MTHANTSPVRVLLVAPAYMTGGQAIEARTILDGFADDPEVHAELQPIDPRIPGWLARIKGLRTVARTPLFLAGLVRRARRADVVHVFTAAFGPFILTTAPAILLVRLLGKPVILNYRDGRAAGHLPARWVRWVIGRATHLVFPSGFLRDVFRRWGFDGEVVPNVVDTERFRFRRREPLRPVVISNRLLEELYAVDNTLQAFAQIRRVCPAAQLLVVGDGDRRESLERLVREDRIEGVEFHGAVPHDEMPDWYDRADVWVNSSRDDNMPHSIIEAFSCGLPVVTTAAGGIPHVVQHGRNGLMVPPDSPELLADAVLQLLADPHLGTRLATEGQRDAKEMYSWRAARGGWARLYRQLVQEPTRRASSIRTPAERSVFTRLPNNDGA